jgi:hypothetical protein
MGKEQGQLKEERLLEQSPRFKGFHLPLIPANPSTNPQISHQPSFLQATFIVTSWLPNSSLYLICGLSVGKSVPTAQKKQSISPATTVLRLGKEHPNSPKE